jgi:hypothetical protein
MQWLGLDIGGAHVKIADGMGFAASYAFSLWKNPQKLAQELRTAIAQSSPCDHLAVTMTGELADCFATKSEGVKFILEALALHLRHTRVYLSMARLTPQVAMNRPLLRRSGTPWPVLGRFRTRGSSNLGGYWLDDKRYCSTRARSPHQAPTTPSAVVGELVYCGVEHAHIAIVGCSHRGQKCSVAREALPRHVT